MKLKKIFSVNFFTGAPAFLWLTCFYALPVIIVFILSFRTVDTYGGIGSEWTLETIRGLANPNYPAIIWRTVWQGLVATAVCVFLAIPISYHLARLSEKWRNLLLLLVSDFRYDISQLRHSMLLQHQNLSNRRNLNH